MQKNIRVLLDVDGVLADFVTPVVAFLNELAGTSFSAQDVSEHDVCDALGLSHLRDQLVYHVSREGFCQSFEKFPGAVEAVSELRNHAEVIIVTSPMATRNWAYERELWLVEHFGFDRKDIVMTGGKRVVLGDIFVDDKVSNVEAWAKHHPHGIAVIWDATYNRSYKPALSNVVRARDWETVVELVKLKRETDFTLS